MSRMIVNRQIRMLVNERIMIRVIHIAGFATGKKDLVCFQQLSHITNFITDKKELLLKVL